jgi:LysR family glycine cleavage system transcriptional activator
MATGRFDMANTPGGERSPQRIDGQLLADLWVFRAAASSCSITAAATKLNVTQSAVSQRILRLESRLGSPLFTRHKSRIELSEAGASLLRAMNQVTLLLTDSLGQIQRTEHKALVVSCLPSLATEWLVPHLEEFYLRHPGIEIFVRSEQVPSTSESLEAEGIDVLIDYRASRATDLHELASVQEHVFPVCSRKYRQVLHGPDRTTAPLVLLHDDVDVPWEDGKRSTEWNSWRTSIGSNWPGRPATARHFNLAHLAYHAAMFHQGVAIGRAGGHRAPPAEYRGTGAGHRRTAGPWRFLSDVDHPARRAELAGTVVCPLVARVHAADAVAECGHDHPQRK